MADSVIVEYPPTPDRIDQCPATPDRIVSVKSPNVNAPSPDIETSQNQPARPPAGESPPPNCAICLERCENKCFTDSCLHQFCFKCLLEWSKVKAECPLCKQAFKSIIHNVKAIDQFEEYHVAQHQLPTSEPPPLFVIPHFPQYESIDLRRPTYHPPRLDVFLGDSVRAGGFSATVQVHPSNNDALQQLLLRGTGSNPPRPHFSPTPAPSLSQLWRRHIYDSRLYAMPCLDVTGRYRDTSARFYRNNPSQIHRLMPWINRDVVCLLRSSEHHVSYVLADIYELLTMFNITSAEFRRRVSPFFGERTAHFIHELFNFARSPYDMYGYDREVRYAPNSEEVVISSSSSDEDAEQLFTNPRRGRTEFTIETRSNRSTFILTGTFDARGGTSNVATASRATATPVDVNINIVDPSTSRLSSEAEDENTGGQAITTAQHSETQPQNILGTSSSIQIDRTNIELSSASSDECEFVLERKAPHLRTPELVSLNSDSDSDVVFISDSLPNPMATSPGTSNTENRKRTSSTRLSFSNGSHSSDSDDDTLANYASRVRYENSLTVKNEPSTSRNTVDDVGSSTVEKKSKNHRSHSVRRSSGRGAKPNRKRTSSSRLSSVINGSETSNSDNNITASYYKSPEKRSRFEFPRYENPRYENSSTVKNEYNIAPSTSQNAILPIPSSSAETKPKKYYSLPVRRVAGKDVKKIFESSLSSEIDDDSATESSNFTCSCEDSDIYSSSSLDERLKTVKKRVKKEKATLKKLKEDHKRKKKNSIRSDDRKSSGRRKEKLSSSEKSSSSSSPSSSSTSSTSSTSSVKKRRKENKLSSSSSSTQPSTRITNKFRSSSTSDAGTD